MHDGICPCGVSASKPFQTCRTVGETWNISDQPYIYIVFIRIITIMIKKNTTTTNNHSTDDDNHDFLIGYIINI